MYPVYQCGRFQFRLNTPNAQPLVMGVLNVTPDSFSDGGKFSKLEYALAHAERMIAEGVDIIDIGGESTRPGSQSISLQQELDRVMPVIYGLRDCGKPLSIDTNKPSIMREAIAAGIDLINDINGFRAPGALEVIADQECGVCVMHMQDTPQTMQRKPVYQDVVHEVCLFLQERVSLLEQNGVQRHRICIDPGFGFGKTLEHNIALLKKIERIQTTLDLPLLAGISRKAMLGQLTGKPAEGRLAASLAGALAAATYGAKIIRVHDVAETVDALKVWQAVMR